MQQAIQAAYERWLKCATDDPDLIPELRAMDEDAVEQAFCADLVFGTAGLRGVLGAGTNRMNVYTVAKATQGMANYVLKNTPAGERRVAVSRDSRLKSELFARVTASVLAANGIEVWIYPELMPVPCLSFATRELHCAAGVMITASHNPAKYNGYKAYGPDGCQMTTQAADAVLAEIQKLDIFNDVKQVDFDEAVREGTIKFVPEDCYTNFIEQVKAQSVLYGEAVDKNVQIIYSPLNGSGLKPVLRALTESGYTNIFVVSEQEKPDGNFPTCTYPNPEIREALALGLDYAKKRQADLMFATDPDCDRVGAAVRDGDDYVLISGNEMGVLLLDYLCAQRTKHGTMPKDPVFVKTIVTTDMAAKVAAHYGVRTINVLTGFKFIGEQILLLEQKGEAHRYIFGYEESYGYLSGSYVRDKDAVDAAFLICEMFACYKSRGISIPRKLAELYETYGYCLNITHSYTFEGCSGMETMRGILARLRGAVTEFGGKRVLETLDYAKGLDGLPKSDVLKFVLEDDCSVVVRPSGTEPKLKAYITVSAKDKETASEIEQRIAESVEAYLK
ncbi:MAG: phospho-sugar mutase [Oscillospiraceae bacterium]|nr:phospho-sugar mutase [Oscillospiraceae bacterium]